MRQRVLQHEQTSSIDCCPLATAATLAAAAAAAAATKPPREVLFIYVFKGKECYTQ